MEDDESIHLELLTKRKVFGVIATDNFLRQSLNIFSISVQSLLKGVLVAFKGQKQGFQRGLNEILEPARTYGFQFRDN